MKLLEKVGYGIGYVAGRVILLKAGWWLFGMEEWCGLGLPLGVALFLATWPVISVHPITTNTNTSVVKLEFDEKVVH